MKIFLFCTECGKGFATRVKAEDRKTKVKCECRGKGLWTDILREYNWNRVGMDWAGDQPYVTMYKDDLKLPGFELVKTSDFWIAKESAHQPGEKGKDVERS